MHEHDKIYPPVTNLCAVKRAAKGIGDFSEITVGQKTYGVNDSGCSATVDLIIDRPGRPTLMTVFVGGVVEGQQLGSLRQLCWQSGYIGRAGRTNAEGLMRTRTLALIISLLQYERPL